MDILNEDGTREKADRKELERIGIVLKGVHDSLLHAADYFETKGFMTQEEIKVLDKTRHLISSKALELTEYL
jgi:hypothetical protein